MYPNALAEANQRHVYIEIELDLRAKYPNARAATNQRLVYIEIGLEL